MLNDEGDAINERGARSIDEGDAIGDDDDDDAGDDARRRLARGQSRIVRSRWDASTSPVVPAARRAKSKRVDTPPWVYLNP
jgi:hypothetical protein